MYKVLGYMYKHNRADLQLIPYGVFATLAEIVPKINKTDYNRL